MKHRFLYIMALLLTVATGAWAQDPDPIDLTPSADGKTWTLAATPAFDVEIEVEYETDLALNEVDDNEDELSFARRCHQMAKIMHTPRYKYGRGR